MNTPQKSQIVVLGAGYAGMLAAFRVAGKAKQQAQVTLINRDANFFERVRMHQAAVGYTKHIHPIADMLRGTNIDFVQGSVTDMNPAQHAITVQTAAGEKQVHYDKLVYALGSTIDTRGVPGIRENALVMTQDGAAKMREMLPTAKRLLIIGGGLTGIETATELAEVYPHLAVTLATTSKFGADLSQKGRDVVAAEFDRMHITVRDHVKIERIEADRAIATDGSELPFDVCLWAGAFAVSELARASGLAVNERGQVRVDETLRSVSHPDIYAAGDAAAFENLRMGCVTAEPMAAHAADNIIAGLKGKSQHAFSFGFGGRCISLGRNAGLIQFVKRDDSPVEYILSGKTAAVVKEMICRYAYYSLPMERRMPGLYMWMGAGQKTGDVTHASRAAL